MGRKVKVILIAGAPGVGKTTTAKLLTKKLQGIRIAEDYIRNLHLGPTWKDQSTREANMALENIVFMTKNYLRHGYVPIIVEDILSTQLNRLRYQFRGLPYLIVNLVMSDGHKQKKRVLTETRDSGYRRWRDALDINEFYLRRKQRPKEIRIDTTYNRPAKVVGSILKAIK